MSDGAFGPDARAAIYGRSLDRCAGCGTRANLTAQHRAARGMGGTRRELLEHTANGVALCGSGTTGCHGWTEAHPTDARELGWRLERAVELDELLAEPYLDCTYGGPSWWRVDVDGCAVYVGPLEYLPERVSAVDRFLAYVRGRA